MGFLLGGPYFHLRGRTGNNVGRVIKGRNVFSMRPTPSEKPPSAAQEDQRLKFGLFASWLSGVTPVLDIGFAKFNAKMSPYNAAVSYNIEKALTGVSPNYSINYALAKFSLGKLAQPYTPLVVAAPAGLANYSWATMLGELNSSPTDQIGLVVYNPDRNLFVMLLNVAVRSVGAYELQLPLDWAGEVVQNWLLAVDAAGKEVSTTAYVGPITVL